MTEPNAEPACEPVAVAPTGPGAPRPDGAAPSPAAPAVEYRDVAFSYRSRRPFIAGLCATVEAGAVTSIVGPNGCGKSTLVKLASGLLRPACGSVAVKGRDVGALSARERARLMAVLAQSARTPPMTVEALVACGRHPHQGLGGRLSPADRAAVEAAMERAGVARFRAHDVRRLSGGERQRAFLAMTLAQDTDLIVLDEPTTYLDINACHDLMALVRDLNRREGKTVAMVIHDIDLALRYSDRLIVMQKGNVTAQGPTGAVLASGAVGDAFAMDICRHDRDGGGCAGEPRGPRPAGPGAPHSTECGYVLYPREVPREK